MRLLSFCPNTFLISRGKLRMLKYTLDSFSLEMCEEEGGGCVELLTGGRELEVTALNVYDYVRKYAHHRMMLSQEKALEVNLSSARYPITGARYSFKHSKTCLIGVCGTCSNFEQTFALRTSNH